MAHSGYDRVSSFLILFLLLALGAITSVGQAAHAAAAAGGSDVAVRQFEKYEASFDLPGASGNPFDPAQNDIDVVFAGSDRAVTVVPAFWDGQAWRVRFAPMRTGYYSWSVRRNGNAVELPSTLSNHFKCVPGTSAGFVRRDPRHIQRFTFDSGRPYYPFGTDVGWLRLPDTYPAHLSRMRDAHMNWARVWMTFWDGKALEWSANSRNSPAIGTLSMDAAKKWDDLFDSADKCGVYVQMTLQHHGQYTAHVDPNWSSNPFNVANGGFLTKPDDFFTNPRAIELTKAKYRYIVARWGYSTHLFAFELFNEVQNITEAHGHFADVVAWHETMSQYLRSIDPYHHLVTTSNSVPGDPLAPIGLDVNQQHIYTPIPAAVFGTLPSSASPVPYFIGEWGPDPESIWRLREGLWAGIMAPTAGAAQYWYWDRMDLLSLWPMFESAGRFLTEGNVAQIGTAHKIMALAHAGGPLADLTFAPGLGWEKCKSYDVTPHADGTVSGIDGVSDFLQGRYHPDLQSLPISIHLNSDLQCKVIVRIATAARAGANPVVSVTGNPNATAQMNYPAAPKDHPVTDTLSVDVPAGPQIVTLTNTGPDWVTLGEIRVTNFASPIEAAARGDDRSAVFFASLREGVQSKAITDGAIRLSGFDPGRYEVRMWNIDDATWFPSITAAASKGDLRVALPNVQCVAGVVTKLAGSGRN